MRIATVSVHACPLAPPGAWETGGMNIYIREVSRHLSALGVDVDVFTRKQDAECEDVVQFAERARVIHLPAGAPHYMPKEQVVGHLPEFICNMREFVSQHELSYDLVHSHYWLSGRVAGYFKNAWHVPMVAMFHTLAELKNDVSLGPDELEGDVRLGIERLTVATADRVIASTPVDQSHLQQRYGADDHRVAIVPCGVDYEVFAPGSAAEARQTLGYGDESIILFVGRIQQLKGVDLLIRSIAVLASRHRAGELGAFRLVIVGGRPTGTEDDPQAREISRLTELADELGVTEYIHWAGPADHEALPRYYQAADVTVMPSTYESFGLVAVESMACGTPVVAARVGGLQATVVDGSTGFLVPWRDPTLYARRIADVLTDPVLRARLGHAARLRARQFGWSAVSTQLLDLYEDLLRTSRADAASAMLVGS